MPSFYAANVTVYRKCFGDTGFADRCKFAAENGDQIYALGTTMFEDDLVMQNSREIFVSPTETIVVRRFPFHPLIDTVDVSSNGTLKRYQVANGTEVSNCEWRNDELLSMSLPEDFIFYFVDVDEETNTRHFRISYQAAGTAVWSHINYFDDSVTKAPKRLATASDIIVFDSIIMNVLSFNDAFPDTRIDFDEMEFEKCVVATEAYRAGYSIFNDPDSPEFEQWVDEDSGLHISRVWNWLHQYPPRTGPPSALKETTLFYYAQTHIDFSGGNMTARSVFGQWLADLYQEWKVESESDVMTESIGARRLFADDSQSQSEEACNLVDGKPGLNVFSRFCRPSSPPRSPAPSPTSSVSRWATGRTPRPSSTPTPNPTKSPSWTAKPTSSPSLKPSMSPTRSPTFSPTPKPSRVPTRRPTAFPTYKPTYDYGGVLSVNNFPSSTVGGGNLDPNKIDDYLGIVNAGSSSALGLYYAAYVDYSKPLVAVGLGSKDIRYSLLIDEGAVSLDASGCVLGLCVDGKISPSTLSVNSYVNAGVLTPPGPISSLYGSQGSVKFSFDMSKFLGCSTQANIINAITKLFGSSIPEFKFEIMTLKKTFAEKSGTWQHVHMMHATSAVDKCLIYRDDVKTVIKKVTSSYNDCKKETYCNWPSELLCKLKGWAERVVCTVKTVTKDEKKYETTSVCAVKVKLDSSASFSTIAYDSNTKKYSPTSLDWDVSVTWGVNMPLFDDDEGTASHELINIYFQGSDSPPLTTFTNCIQNPLYCVPQYTAVRCALTKIVGDTFGSLAAGLIANIDTDTFFGMIDVGSICTKKISLDFSKIKPYSDILGYTLPASQQICKPDLSNLMEAAEFKAFLEDTMAKIKTTFVGIAGDARDALQDSSDTCGAVGLSVNFCGEIPAPPFMLTICITVTFNLYSGQVYYSVTAEPGAGIPDPIPVYSSFEFHGSAYNSIGNSLDEHSGYVSFGPRVSGAFPGCLNCYTVLEAEFANFRVGSTQDTNSGVGYSGGASLTGKMGIKTPQTPGMEAGLMFFAVGYSYAPAISDLW